MIYTTNKLQRVAHPSLEMYGLKMVDNGQLMADGGYSWIVVIVD